MGLLRAVADAVIVGAGTLRSEPQHRWTAQYIAGEQHVVQILHDLYHFSDRRQSSSVSQQCEDFLTVVCIFVHQGMIPLSLPTRAFHDLRKLFYYTLFYHSMIFR